jgi:hypothetical protein
VRRAHAFQLVWCVSPTSRLAQLSLGSARSLVDAPFCSCSSFFYPHPHPTASPSSSSTSPSLFLVSLFFFHSLANTDTLHSFGIHYTPSAAPSLTFTISTHTPSTEPSFRIFSQQISIAISFFSCQIQRNIYTTLIPTFDSYRFSSIHHFCRVSTRYTHLRNIHSLTHPYHSV